MGIQMMKKKILDCGKVVVFVLLVVFALEGTSRLLMAQDNYIKYSGFYAEKEPFDVLFFGSSRMMDGVYPMELWENYGITSYNMAQHCERLRITYWQIVQAIHVNKPRVIVVDVSIHEDGKISAADESEVSFLHQSLDHMPTSLSKYRAIRDILEDDVDAFEYIVPLTMYHNRWDTLDEAERPEQDPVLKGTEYRIATQFFEHSDWSAEECASLAEYEMEYFRRIIELCEKEKIPCVFTVMPSLWISEDPQECAKINSMEAYAGSLGIPFFNFAKEDEMINYQTDFYDKSHLNASGAMKITNILGAYLCEQYDLPAAKKDRTTKKWMEAEEAYLASRQEVYEAIKADNYPLDYLTLINRDDVEYVIQISDPDCMDLFWIRPILQEMGVDTERASRGEYIYRTAGIPDSWVNNSAKNPPALTVWVYDKNMELLDTAYFVTQ